MALVFLGDSGSSRYGSRSRAYRGVLGCVDEQGEGIIKEVEQRD